jgi:hypothetical protein
MAAVRNLICTFARIKETGADPGFFKVTFLWSLFCLKFLRRGCRRWGHFLVPSIAYKYTKLANERRTNSFLKEGEPLPLYLSPRKEKRKENKKFKRLVRNFRMA